MGFKKEKRRIKKSGYPSPAVITPAALGGWRSGCGGPRGFPDLAASNGLGFNIETEKYAG